MPDGPTAKKALSKNIYTGSLNYKISGVMKKEYGNKTRATGFLPLIPNTSTYCY